MDVVFWVALTALLGSLLTFFSGFGLGTLLLPVFAVFFPTDLAVALTGIVHFANNLFKLVLTARHIDRAVLMRFGLAAIVAALAGAWLLMRLSSGKVLFAYNIGGKHLSVTPVGLVIGLLLIVFALWELLPALSRVQFHRRHMVWGGLLSGFFGGLSGHQGALRSAFLIRSGLSKEAFIATGVAIAFLIDVMRLSVYATGIDRPNLQEAAVPLMAGVLSAMAGALAGQRLLKKMTLPWLQRIVGTMLLLMGMAMAAGLI